MREAHTWELVLRLAPGVIDREAQARALFKVLATVTGMEPARYDLNQRGQWRPYKEEALVVDTLTQRTQLVILVEERAPEQGGAVAMIATGKHGEPPQVLARWSGEEAISEAIARRWQEAIVDGFEATSLQMGMIRRLEPGPGQATPAPPLLVVTRSKDLIARLRAAGEAPHLLRQDKGIWNFALPGRVPGPRWQVHWQD